MPWPGKCLPEPCLSRRRQRTFYSRLSPIWKTNDVMKVLTIFSVFFMPLTFIVGIYGMNFQYMPELQQRWGYPASLILMAAVSALIYGWFKRKDWL